MNWIWIVVLGLVLLGNYSQAVAVLSTNAETIFTFRDPRLVRYQVTPPAPLRLASLAQDEWLAARPDNGSTTGIQLGSRIVLRVKPGTDLDALLAARPATVSRHVGPDLFILQSSDAWTAALVAQDLARQESVSTAHPVRRKLVARHSPYAAKPNDPRFPGQWHLENRAGDGTRTGVDLNVRAAWPITLGEGVIVAVVDDGVDLAHPDLTNNAVTELHTNFISSGQANGAHASLSEDHGTPVAGLIAAQGGNGIGVSGVAPNAHFASWVIFDRFDSLPDEEQMMDMFQYSSNVVSIQNHSWGNSTIEYLPVSDLETAGISNAVNFGRAGKGVVIVRSGGNQRNPLPTARPVVNGGGDVNLDGYALDPQVIAVAVRSDGRVARYSNPGACILVAAPSAEVNDNGIGLDLSFPTIYTTDRLGSAGLNTVVTASDSADYAFGSSGFSGTSASAPEIAGVAALILSANTNLSYRDVQQVLLLSARQTDPLDYTTQTNGAGLLVNHNSGFGVPDAGEAVKWARAWQPRPPATTLSFTVTNEQVLVDDALQLQITGANVPTNLTAIPCFPDQGLQAETGTASLALVNAGQATNDLTVDLTGKAALIQRGFNLFSDKIAHAARAGAAFAVIYNNTGGDARVFMQGTDYVPIPAVCISQNAGEALAAFLATNTSVTASLQPLSAVYSFAVTNTLSCEHVTLSVDGEHDNFADLRLVLVSPSGTHSVMQAMSPNGPITFDGWTFASVQHFFESSAGTWNVYITDESPGRTGVVHSVTLNLTGVPITDADHDGLDDIWEKEHFGNLNQRPLDDPDGDGSSNLREMLRGTNPSVEEVPFVVDLSPLDTGLLRLSWAGRTNRSYQVLGGTEVNQPFIPLATFAGKFPELEWIAPSANLYKFFQVRAMPITP